MRRHLAFLALLVGCGGTTDNGTSAGTGGQGASGTGGGATGGRSYIAVPAAGGITLFATGGANPMGGTVPTGGTKGVGGEPAGGGLTSTGGTSSAIGGSAVVGGLTSTGGSSSCIKWTCPAIIPGGCNTSCGPQLDGCGGTIDCGPCCCGQTCEQICLVGAGNRPLCAATQDPVIYNIACPKSDGCGGVLTCYCIAD